MRPQQSSANAREPNAREANAREPTTDPNPDSSTSQSSSLERTTLESGRFEAARPAADADASAPLSHTDAEQLSALWDDIQGGFVDDPRSAVARADELVGRVVERVIRRFAERRAALERQWDRGDSVTTEELRITLQRYREFFRRLLSVNS
jgi:hypothetical protein